MSRSDSIAWAAGLFEGEGHLGLGSLSLTMCDEDLVRRFFNIVGCGTVWQNPGFTRGGKRSWKWKCGQRDQVNRVLEEMLPYLGERKTKEYTEFKAWYTRSCERRRHLQKVSCPNCGYTSTPAGLSGHRKRCDKQTMEAT